MYVGLWVFDLVFVVDSLFDGVNLLSDCEW